MISNAHIDLSIPAKGLAIIESCTTKEHCAVAHAWIQLAKKQLNEYWSFVLDEAYLTRILQVTGVI